MMTKNNFYSSNMHFRTEMSYEEYKKVMAKKYKPTKKFKLKRLGEQ